MNLSDEYIDNELKGLPEEIGEFKRRFIAVGTPVQFTIQYAKGGICTNNYSGLDRDLLYAVSSNDFDETIYKTRRTIDLHKQLETGSSVLQEDVFINPEMFDRGLTEISLVQSLGTGIFKVQNVLYQSYSEIYFYVQAKDYKLTFRRKGRSFILSKNNHSISIELPEIQESPLTIQWSIDQLIIRTNEQAKAQQTPLIYPPSSLYNWARLNILTSPPSYNRPGKVFNRIKASLEQLNEEISRSSNIGVFWDKQYDGQKITSSKPKHEAEITQDIESRLSGIALANNLEITRESRSGNGQIDLILSGYLNSGKRVSVCIEVKKAHSDDLVHGLQKQLPEYMRRKSIDYGIYCILYFGKDFPPKKKLFSSINNDKALRTDELLSHLLPLLPTAGIQITPIIIDVSNKLSPSKM